MEFVIGFLSKTADDIGGNGDIRTVFEEVITNFSEILDSVLSIHFLEYVVMSSLDGDVNERVYSGVVEEVSDCSQMFQNVRRVRHSDLSIKNRVLSS